MHIDHFAGDLSITETMSSTDSVSSNEMNSINDSNHSSSSTMLASSPHMPVRKVPLMVQSNHDLDSNSKSNFRGGGTRGNDANGICPREGENDSHFGQIHINRSTMSLASLERIHPPEEAYRARRELVRRMLPEKWSAFSTLRSVFPILKWLPNYDIRRDLSSDIIAGITVLALQIPQGLAYSKLAGVAPSYGLFGTFFSMIIFSLMSTSKHASMGLYAITSMMCRGVVTRFNESHPDESPITILVTLCLMTGIIQTAFGLLRLGNLSLLFSDNFLSAFTVGCTVLILNSQFPPTLGINFAPDENKDLGILSECLNIILTIIISMAFSLGDKGVEIVGEIPSGFRPPTLPRMDLIPALLMDAIIMAVVASVCQVSMSKMLAKKYSYKISLNQEFLAYGCTNVFCSFFQCFPTCSSLARTNVNENAGAKTQLSTIVTTGLLVIFLLFFTAYLSPLPKATLSCIIIVAMIPSIVMIKDFFAILYVSRFDAILWMVTFLTVTFLGVNIGIYCGLLTSIAIILMRAAIPTSSVKYPLAMSELYFPPDVFNGLSSQSLQKCRVAVFSFNGPLTFLSAATFRSDIRRQILEDTTQSNCTLPNQPVITILQSDANNNGTATTLVASKKNNGGGKPARCGAIGKRHILQTLILDMSQINYIDVTGIEMLNDLKDELMEQNVRLLLACPSISVLSTLERSQFFKKSIPKEHCFLSIIDAVAFASDPSATVPYTPMDNTCMITLNGFDKVLS